MTPLDLFTLTLAIWYSAYVVVKLSAPFNLLGRLRTWAEKRGTQDGGLHDLLNCIYCTSFWVAVFWLTVWNTPARPLVYPFALAGGALMLHRYTGGMHT